MPTNYPGGLDTFPTRVTNDPIPASDHNNPTDAIEAIEAELGTNPSSSEATVAARFATAETNHTNHATAPALSGTPHSMPALATDGQMWIREGGALVAQRLKPSAADASYFLGPITQAVSDRAGNDANDGLSWGTAKKTIEAAAAALPTGGQVLIEAGYYTPTVTLPLFGHTYRGMGSGQANRFQGGRPHVYAGFAGDLFDVVEGGGVHDIFAYTGRSDSGAFLKGVSDAEATTTLSSSVTSSDTTIPVVSTAAFPSSGRIILEWTPNNKVELIRYTGKTGTSFTGCTRGVSNTRAQAHPSGAAADTTRIGHINGSGLRVTGESATNTWTRVIDLDGSLMTGSISTLGCRSVWFDKCEFFGCKTAGETLRLKRLIHAWFTNSSVILAPATGIQQGIKVLDTVSEEVYFSNFELLGDFYSEAAGSGGPNDVGVQFHGMIGSPTLSGAISFGTGSKGNIVQGQVPAPTSDLGTNNVVMSPLRGPPRARVYHSVDQNVTTATLTTVAFNSERYDTGTIHDNSTNNSRLTCKEPGTYSIGASVSFSGNGTGMRILAIYRNGTRIASHVGVPVTGDATDLTIVTQYDLVATDYVEVKVYQTSGGTLQISTLSTYSPEFWMSRVGSGG